MMLRIKADEALAAKAVEAAANADVAVIFAGLPDSFESEGYDRKHLGMPNRQNALIEAVAEAQPNTIVVLHNGAPVEMPWLGKVKAVLEAYLGGQAVGGAGSMCFTEMQIQADDWRKHSHFGYRIRHAI